MEGIGQGIGDLDKIPRQIRASVDVGIDGVGSGFALLFCCDNVLFQQGHEELVGVLQRAKGQYVRCIDFVGDGDFRIKVWIVRKRVLFKVIDLILDGLSVVADLRRWQPWPLRLRRRKARRKRIEILRG